MPIEYFKIKARRILGDCCLLQRDRYERALFFSDFLKTQNQALVLELENAGFDVKISGEYALFSPNALLLKEFLNNIGKQPLPETNEDNIYIVSCANILRRHEADTLEENMDAYIKLMHILNLGDFYKACVFLLGRLAVCLRENIKAPAHGAELLLHAYNKHKEKMR
ncbi:MAG: hypothetical protein Q4E07_02630 [Eubacteriales bacterium]|nr:hypothetical protein [Eubacteriales bacterium]